MLVRVFAQISDLARLEHAVSIQMMHPRVLGTLSSLIVVVLEVELGLEVLVKVVLVHGGVLVRRDDYILNGRRE